MKIKIIINAGAGPNDKEPERHQLQAIFAQSAQQFSISLAHSGAEIIELAASAVREGYGTIVAGGGDGTINAVASQLLGTDVRLGVLPQGTLNHFARDVGIPLDLESAAQVILAGHTQLIDAAEVNGRTFLNNSGLGLYPRMVRHRELQQQRGRGKWFAAAWAAYSLLRRYPFLDVRLSIDGQTLQRRTPLVFVGNNQYKMAGFSLDSRERLDAGCLSVYLTQHTGRLGLLRLMLHALTGSLSEARDFDALCVQEVWISTRHKTLLVATDGEVAVMKTPLHFCSLPGALCVLVPLKEETNQEF